MTRPIVLSALIFSAAAFAAEPPALNPLTYAGDQSALEALDRDLNAAGSDAAKLAALEKRLLATVRSTTATFAARQAAAQRLGLVLGLGPGKLAADTLKPLGAMLADERDAELARLALDPVAGDAVDRLYVAALPKAAGRTRLALLDSVATRRIAAAVPELVKLVRGQDARAAAGAARALGAIADAAAVTALDGFAEPSEPALAAAKLAAAPRAPAATAAKWLADLQAKAREPAHRVSAFRTALSLDSAGALARIAAALDGTDAALKAVALEALRDLKGADPVAALGAKLAQRDAATQAALLHAFARRGDAAAVPLAVKAAGHGDLEVRVAAYQALALLPGTPEVAVVLAAAITKADVAEARAARQSLSQLNGAGVSAAIQSGAERGEPSLRAVYLEQLALRNQTEAVPFLLKARGEPDATVRAAAVGALGDLAPFSEQPALIAWAVGAQDDAEQSRALRALVSLTLRNPAAATRAQAIFAAIESADAALAQRLLPILGRLGGEESAACAARLALKGDAAVAPAAVTALTRWNDATALDALGRVATGAAPALRVTAVQGLVRYFERNRDRWTPAQTKVLSAVVPVASDPATRLQLLGFLARANDKAALQFVEGLKNDGALGTEATYVAAVIAANVAGSPRVRASSPGGTGNILDGKTSTRWSADANGEEWVEVDFRAARPLRRLTLDTTGRTDEHPERYEVYVTDDPKAPGKPVASGAGNRTKTVVELPAGTRGRYVVIKNVAERRESQWAICELFVD